jgi:hypothetical protein
MLWAGWDGIGKQKLSVGDRRRTPRVRRGPNIRHAPRSEFWPHNLLLWLPRKVRQCRGGRGRADLLCVRLWPGRRVWHGHEWGLAANKLLASGCEAASGRCKLVAVME